MRRRGLLIQLAVVALFLVASPNAAALEIRQVPEISGEARVGGKLTATPGDWVPNSNDVTATYQWRRCSASGCADIEGATNREGYTLTDDDGGHTIRIQLTVRQDTASDVKESLDSPLVPPAPPSNSESPTISGFAREGRVLTASPGKWRGTPPLTFEYAWQRCDASGESCDPIPNATSMTYTLSALDVGTTVRVVETATNAVQSVSARSRATDLVSRAPLLNAGPPTIAGVPEVDRSLTATPGQWLSSGPIDFLYEWLRCRGDGSGCDVIPGAESSSYQVRLLDIGFRLRVNVTAIGHQGAGSVERESAPTGTVPAPQGVLPFTQSGTTAPPPTTKTSAAFMRPFPRVRIKGYYTPVGAVVQLLTIKRAVGARIAIRCRGGDCPFRRRVHRGRKRLRVRSVEKSYRAGTRLTIRVTKAELIGKYTRIVIRANRPPKRRDRCLMPDSKRPVECPAVGSVD